MNPLQFYKCLADQTRLTCLMLIQQEGELCVCELMEAIQESQPKISRHLAQLKKHQLLSDRRQGQWVFYRLSPNLPPWALDILKTSDAPSKAILKESYTRLSMMRERPERDKACC